VLLDVVIERVVGNVTVKNPLSRFLGGPDDVVPLARPDVYHVRLEARRWPEYDSVAGDDGKRAAVQFE